MEKTLKKLVHHCKRHHFVSDKINKFSLLGSLLQSNIRNNWVATNITTNINSFCLEHTTSQKTVTPQLLNDFCTAKSLVGSDVTLTFASSSSENQSDLSVPSGELTSFDDLVHSMPTSFLDLRVFSPPARKIDDFSLLQKRRRYWWKSLLKHPELLSLKSVSQDSDSLIEQQIELGSTVLEGHVLEKITVWKPQIFEQLEVC